MAEAAQRAIPPAASQQRWPPVLVPSHPLHRVQESDNVRSLNGEGFAGKKLTATW